MSKINDVMFSSKKTEWETPQDFFNEVNNKFNFQLDVCALPDNTKCKRFYSPIDDGLSMEWHKEAKSIWMNPPYGREISKWIEKAFNESKKGATIVALLPARTDTKWFHSFILNKADIVFIKGRLKFGGSKNSAPFPSMLVIWNNESL